MSLRALALAALGEAAPQKPAGNDCPAGAPLRVPHWGSMKTHASGVSGAAGAAGASDAAGTAGATICRSERLAFAREMGKVPALYADAFARLQCQALPGIPSDWQTRAANMAGQLLDMHGVALLTLQWPVAAIFNSPLVLATFGESAALDLRKAGLAWQLREGDAVERLAPNGAMIRCGDGNSFAFQWRPAHGQN